MDIMDCDFITPFSTRCCNPAHRCCDCGQHVIPRHNDAGELLDHDCRP